MNIKTKTTAGLLAIFLGGLGFHKFYLGKPFQGLLYLLFCWTWIPSIISLIEGILYLTMSEPEFNLKYNGYLGMLADQHQQLRSAPPQQIAQSVTVNLPEGFGQAPREEPSPRALPAPAAAGEDLVTRLTRLNELRLAGLLTDEEFLTQKTRLLNQA